jgi:SOS-response transcriptional repressor LexA
MDAFLPGPHYPDMANILQTRVSERMKALDLKAAPLAVKAGLGESFVRDILRGKTAVPKADNLALLAAALSTTPEYLLGTEDKKVRRGPDVEGFTSADLSRLPIRGEVAAGRWLETPALLEPAEITDFVEGLAMQPALAAWTYGLRVRGTSINKLAVDGDILVCLDVMSGIEFGNRDLVIVERVRDQGALREVTAKRLVRRDGRFHLMPESTDPMWQTEIEVGEDVPQDDAETRFIAKVKHIIKPVG